MAPRMNARNFRLGNVTVRGTNRRVIIDPLSGLPVKFKHGRGLDAHGGSIGIHGDGIFDSLKKAFDIGKQIYDVGKKVYDVAKPAIEGGLKAYDAYKKVSGSGMQLSAARGRGMQLSAARGRGASQGAKYFAQRSGYAPPGRVASRQGAGMYHSAARGGEIGGLSKEVRRALAFGPSDAAERIRATHGGGRAIA